MNDILKISVGEELVATVDRDRLPIEIERTIQLRQSATVIFEDVAGPIYRHHVAADTGWLHLYVLVRENLACQASAVASPNRARDPDANLDDGEVGVRFQPFFLEGAENAPDLTGQGLFARGLHFGGTITPGNILLSCRCDACGQTFLAKSFHTGWGGETYFYSESGRFTLSTYLRVGEARIGHAEPEYPTMQTLEDALPNAPDGTKFLYSNPFRCLHCAAPYVNFQAHPALRKSEYYGLYLKDTPPLHFP